MKIIIDWDNTLFDTTRLIRVSLNLAKKHGAVSTDWIKAAIGGYGHKYEGRAVYSIWNHAKHYSKLRTLNREKFLKDYFKTHQNIQYLYSDTLKFLREAGRIGRVELVTYGHKRFQDWKIDMSKARDHIDRVRVIRTLKAGLFQKILAKDETNIFVDDKALEIDEVKRIFPEVIAIHIRRPGSHHARKKSKLRDYEVRDLMQALKIINSINKKITKNVDEAVRAMRAGKAVAYPTDTAYGLGVDATNLKAIKKLWKIKERGVKPVHIIVSDINMGRKYARIDAQAEKLFKKFSPGPITVIADLRMQIAELGSFKKLSAGTGTIGIRIPKNIIALQLVRKFGRPITTTSANPSKHISGGATPYSVEHSYKQFRGKKHQPDLYLDGDVLPKRKTSTIVRVTNGKVKIFREGPITLKQIEKAIR